MANLPHNIERIGSRYVGYGLNHVWRISGDHREGWRAVTREAPHLTRRAPLLRELGLKIETPSKHDTNAAASAVEAGGKV